MTLPLLKLERAPVSAPDRSVILTAGSDKGLIEMAFDQLLGGALDSTSESISTASLSIDNELDIKSAEMDEKLLSHNPRSLLFSRGVDEETVVMSDMIQVVDITRGDAKDIVTDEALSVVDTDDLLSEEGLVLLKTVEKAHLTELNQSGKASRVLNHPGVSFGCVNQVQRPSVESIEAAATRNLPEVSEGIDQNCIPFALLKGVESGVVKASIMSEMDDKDKVDSVIVEDLVEGDLHEIDSLSTLELKHLDNTHDLAQANVLSGHMQSQSVPHVIEAKKPLEIGAKQVASGEIVLEEVGTVDAMSMSMNDALIQNKEQGDEAVAFNVASPEAKSVSTHALFSSSAVSHEKVDPVFEAPFPVFSPTTNGSMMPPVTVDNRVPPANITQTGATPLHTPEALMELKPTVLQHLAYLEAHRPATVAIDIKLDTGVSVELMLKLTQSGKLQVNFGSEASAYKAALQEGWRGLSATIEQRGWVLDGPHFEGVRANQAVVAEQLTSLGGRKANQTQASAYAVHTSPLERQPGAKPPARLKFNALSEALSGQFA